MAIDKATIDNLLLQLNDYIDRVEQMEFTEADLLKDKLIQDALSRRLQIAVGVCIDICMHIISGLNLPIKDTAVDAFELVGNEKIIDQGLANRMADAAKFRNLLVHGYAKIDYKEVYKNYKGDLQDLKDFVKVVTIFLEKNPHLVD